MFMCTNCNNCKKMSCGCTPSMVAKVLVIIGGLNWGFYGAGLLAQSENSWNLVNMLLGAWPVVEAVVYLLVGISALVMIFGCRCKKCMACCASCKVDAPTTGTQM